jgi:hypothetical protein
LVIIPTYMAVKKLYAQYPQSLKPVVNESNLHHLVTIFHSLAVPRINVPFSSIYFALDSGSVNNC